MTDEAIFTPLLPHEAPPRSRVILENARRHFGFVPNLLASMASSPVALGVYFNANVGFEFGTLTPAERQIVLLTASKENNCGYCSISHSALARFFANVPVDALIAIESGENPQDPKLKALVSITRELVARRGHILPEMIQLFFDAGYKKEQLLEVLIGIGIKTISNYFDHIAALEMDDEFKRMISLQA
jgi:AhpD family alkylhydroperoxidase